MKKLQHPIVKTRAGTHNKNTIRGKKKKRPDRPSEQKDHIILREEKEHIYEDDIYRTFMSFLFCPRMRTLRSHRSLSAADLTVIVLEC